MSQQEAVTQKAKRPPVEYTAITMEDGRLVDFPGNRRLIKESSVSDHEVSVRLDFRNGVTRTFKVPHKLLNRFAAHGAEQKLGDETAGMEDPDDMVVAVDTLMDRLHKGEWGITRSAGDSFAGASVVIRALCEVSKKSVEEVKAFLQGKLDGAEARGEKLTRRDLYQSFRNPASKVGQVIARLEAEKLVKASKVDANELVDELGGVA